MKPEQIKKQDPKAWEYYEMAKSGTSIEEIARKLMITRERVRQQVKKVEYMLGRDDWKGGLRTRAQNVLENAGLNDRKSVIEALKEGRLHPKNQRNFGRRSYHEIAEYFGVEIPPEGFFPVMSEWRIREFCKPTQRFSKLTPYEMAARWHIENCPDVRFSKILEDHLFHGHVISGPDRFVLGRQVWHDWPDNWLRDPTRTDDQGDCWMVWLWAGDVKGWLTVVPWRLPWLCWHRGERLRMHRFPAGNHRFPKGK